MYCSESDMGRVGNYVNIEVKLSRELSFVSDTIWFIEAEVGIF